MSLEAIISVGVSIIVAVLGIITSFSLQKKAAKQELKIKTFESLDEENKELRKDNYELQLVVLELQRTEARRDREIQLLKDQRDEFIEQLSLMRTELFRAKEREFQLQSEVGLLRQTLEDCQRTITEIVKQQE